MIVGTVNAACELVIRVAVQDPHGGEAEVEAVVDTGYTGSLSLSPSLVASLGLPYHSHVRTALGDGSVIRVGRYKATVVWDGQPRYILVQSLDGIPLVGLTLLYGYDLRARIEPGGRVEIEEIP